MDLNRRFFLGGALAVAGSAFVPLVGFSKPQLRLWGDGVHDDTEALNALFAGEDVACETAGIVRSADRWVGLNGAKFSISRTVSLRGSFFIDNCSFVAARDWDRRDETLLRVHSDAKGTLNRGLLDATNVKPTLGHAFTVDTWRPTEDVSGV